MEDIIKYIQNLDNENNYLKNKLKDNENINIELQESINNFTKVSIINNLNKQLKDKIYQITLLEKQIIKLNNVNEELMNENKKLINKNNINELDLKTTNIEQPSNELIETSNKNTSNYESNDKLNASNDKLNASNDKSNASNDKLNNDTPSDDPLIIDTTNDDSTKMLNNTKKNKEKKIIKEPIIDTTNQQIKKKSKNKFQELQYKKIKYLLDVSSNEIYDIINDKPNKIIGTFTNNKILFM